MQSLENMLTRSDFRKPELTAEQWAENDAKVRQWEAEIEQQKRSERLQRAGIPEGYIDAVPETWALRWAENPSKGILIQGQVGRGKTYQACAILKKAIEDGHTARFTTFDDMLRECKASFSNAETEQAIISRYANVGILCIDDMGKERLTEWSLPIVFAIINKRSMSLKPTIITTQHTGKQLVERMTVNGDSETARAIVSRFFEYDRITIEGKDWRRDSE